MGNHKNNKDDKATKSEFMKMVKSLGLTPDEVRDMLGAPKRDKEGVLRHRNGGVVKKQMAGGGMMKMAKKKMRGGGMAKMAKKKMRGGGMAAKKKMMMRGGMAKKKK